MAKKSFFLARGDDWQGLYVDGKLVYQHHKVDAHTLSQELTKAGVDFKTGWVDFNFLCDHDGLPENLDDVEFEE